MSPELQDLLRTYGQEHLLAHSDLLTPDQRRAWEQQLKALDLPLLRSLFQDLVLGADHKAANLTQRPLEPLPFSPAALSPHMADWTARGEELLAQGKAAAFLVAGGQGSRLGIEGPKGVCGIGLPSGKSLFQLQAERLLHLGKRYQRPVPWCVMTSPLNHSATVEFFQERQYFGLDPAFIRFFPQGMLPALDPEGRILMESPGQLALAPDGNGGCFRALHSSGSLQWLRDLGVEFVFLYGVDNALVLPCDPPFLGQLALSTAPASSKVVAKAHAAEKVGVFALQDGTPTVIEYSDLPASLRESRGANAALLFNGANIATHLFRLSALESVAQSPLPYHVAHKKISYFLPSQGRVDPCAPNAWKFEQFLFDIFPVLGEMLTYGVSRPDEFAPVKNASGEDSPHSALTLLGRLHRRWLENANIALPSSDALYEISPLLSYKGEGLTQIIWEQELHKAIQPLPSLGVFPHESTPSPETPRPSPV